MMTYHLFMKINDSDIGTYYPICWLTMCYKRKIAKMGLHRSLYEKERYEDMYRDMYSRGGVKGLMLS